jgi:hypothetical protein
MFTGSARLDVPRAVQLVDRHGYDRSSTALGERVIDAERFFSGWV